MGPGPRVLGRRRSTRPVCTIPILFAQPQGEQLDRGELACRSSSSGRPLWQLGGARAAVLIPVLSVVLAAYAARRISQLGVRAEMDGSRSGSSVCSRRRCSTAPTSGSTRPRWRSRCSRSRSCSKGACARSLLGGLAAGLAAVMRNDMLVDVRRARRCRTARSRGAALLSRRAGASSWSDVRVLGLVLFVNSVVEHLVLAPSTGFGARDCWSGKHHRGCTLVDRLRDAVITSVGVLANEYWLASGRSVAVIGLGILLMAAGAADRSGGGVRDGGRRCGHRVGRHALAVRRPSASRPCPGSSARHPSPRSGSSASARDASRCCSSASLIAIPTGVDDRVGRRPQRRSGEAATCCCRRRLLIVLAAAQVRRLGARPLVLAARSGLGAVMSLIGVTWHIERTRAITPVRAARCSAVPADVVIIGDQPWMGQRDRQLVRRPALAHRSVRGRRPNEADAGGRRGRRSRIARGGGRRRELDVIDSATMRSTGSDDNPTVRGVSSSRASGPPSFSGPTS